MADAADLRARTIQHYGDVFSMATELMVNELREAAPLGVTGDTRRGIEAVPQGNATTLFAATIISRGKGGDYVEKGHGEIRPKKPGGVLVFEAGIGGVSTPQSRASGPGRNPGLVFTRRVKAVPAKPWFDPIVQKWTEFVQRAAARVR